MVKKLGIVQPDNGYRIAHLQMKMALSVLRLDMSISFFPLKLTFYQCVVCDKKEISLLELSTATLFFILDTSAFPLIQSKKAARKKE